MHHRQIWLPNNINTAAVGLGDRMRGLASALVLSKANERQLHTHWVPNWACPATFEELFEPVAGLDLFTISHLTAESCELAPEMIWTFDGNIIPEKVYRELSFLHRAAHPHFTDAAAFQAAWSQELRSWQPQLGLRDKIAQVSHNFAPTMVAIHLRRTDVMFSRKKPITLENADDYDAALWAEVERVHEIHPEAEFFVAADREDYLQIWLEMLRERGMTGHVFEKRWNPAEGRQTSVQDALVDLYLLAKCHLLLGSVRSSMLRIATGLGGGHVQLVPPAGAV